MQPRHKATYRAARRNIKFARLPRGYGNMNEIKRASYKAAVERVKKMLAERNAPNAQA